MAKGGKEYRRLVAAFERIFGATIFFGTDSVRGSARMVHRWRFNFLREAQIWYDRNAIENTVDERFENVIVLSDEFYTEILAHPIPTDIEAVKILASAPAVLDLFLWLVYRCFDAKGKERIPLFGDFGLTAQLARSNTQDLDASERCFSNGYRRSIWSGRNVPRKSAQAASTPLFNHERRFWGNLSRLPVPTDRFSCWLSAAFHRATILIDRLRSDTGLCVRPLLRQFGADLWECRRSMTSLFIHSEKAPHRVGGSR